MVSCARRAFMPTKATIKKTNRFIASGIYGEKIVFKIVISMNDTRTW
jgi:hypothetical protein